MYFLDSMFGWVGAALIGAIPGLILSVLVWAIAPSSSTIASRRAPRPRSTARRPCVALFLQPAILLCLAYFALIAANTVGIQQFAVPAWTRMFGVSENYRGALPDRLRGRLGGGHAGRRLSLPTACATTTGSRRSGCWSRRRFTVPIAMQSRVARRCCCRCWRWRASPAAPPIRRAT